MLYWLIIGKVPFNWLDFGMDKKQLDKLCLQFDNTPLTESTALLIVLMLQVNPVDRIKLP